MVSNSLKLGLQELLEALERIKSAHGDDPDYREARATLPADWPM